MNQRQPDGEYVLIRKMREILAEIEHQEVCLAGKVTRGCGGDLSLSSFPVGVYGFSVELDKPEELFEEAREKELSNLENPDEFIPIHGTKQYPLYWGKDSYIGQRIHPHLTGSDKYKGTGLIRLNMYKSLRGKEIYCAIVIVDENTADKVERLLQKKFPNLLKTTQSG